MVGPLPIRPTVNGDLMSAKLVTTLKGLILIGLGLFLTSCIINGTLLYYINRRFARLTWVAAILL